MVKKRGKNSMDAALDFLSVKARTVREVEQKLDELNFGESEVNQTVERLKELNYLNDQKYASDFVDSRLRTKPVSRKKLKEQLYTHLLSKEVIAEAVAAVDDAAEMKNTFSVAEKLQTQFSKLPFDEAKRRVVKRLAARGFTYDCIKICVERLYGDAEGMEEAFFEGEVQNDDEA
jgi:regulatory protein